MALRIRALRNNLPGDKERWYAFASHPSTIGTEAFIDRMAAGRTTITRTEILAVFQLAREELTALLAEGYAVSTPLGKAVPVASGRLAGPDEAFRPRSGNSGHSLRIDFRIAKDIEAGALNKIQCVRDERGDTLSPRLLTVEPTGGAPSISAGVAVKFDGSRLKFDPGDGECGVFLADPTRGEIRLGTYIEIRPSRIVALLPTDLEAGSYVLFVRTRSRGGRPLESREPSPFVVTAP